MKTRVVKILVLMIAVASFFGCKKADTTSSVLEDYFEDNVLNRNFSITYAMDNGTVITGDYAGYIFLLKKGSDYYNGPLVVTRDGTVITGSWSSNSDYGKLRITLPASPESFKFLTRDWRFTSKKLPTLKFSPWGSADATSTALTMERE